jgi:hypothetical protein
MIMEFDEHGNILSPAQLRARAGVKPKPKSGRLVISGSRMEAKKGKSQYIPQMQNDMREFLTCANSSYPGLILVQGDADGVDQTGGSIWEELGGSVAKVPHDTFKWPTDRNPAMLDGSYEQEDSDIGQLENSDFRWKGDWFDRGHKTGQKIRGRRKAAPGTSPKGAFLAFWSHENDGISLKDKSRERADSKGTYNTVKTGLNRLGRDSVCDVWKTGASECCAELKRVLG